MNRTMFNSDLHNEKVLGEYLDEYFYSKIGFNQFLREEDGDEQYAGIDVRFNVENQEYLVDEKGYLSKPTIQNTFVLELSFINPRNERVEGWFYNPVKRSTHYLFCWADRDDIDIYGQELAIKNLHRVEVMIVDRVMLQNYLVEQYGINRTYIQENQNQLLRDLQNRSINLPNSKSKYMLSNHLMEKPLNIVMTKEEYLDSGAVEARCMVYRDRIENLL